MTGRHKSETERCKNVRMIPAKEKQRASRQKQTKNKLFYNLQKGAQTCRYTAFGSVVI